LKFPGDPQKIVSSRKENTIAYALYEHAIYIIADGKLSKELTGLKYNARSLEINHSNNELYIGADDGHIHIYDLSLNFIGKNKFHMGEVTVIKISHNEKLVASGDNVKFIYVWNAETKEVVCDRFSYHSSKVFDIDWSQDDNSLISGSLDKSVILWNVANNTKTETFSETDIEVVKVSKFISDSEFVCGGHCCAIRKYKH
jgi:WD40 repeat protein